MTRTFTVLLVCGAAAYASIILKPDPDARAKVELRAEIDRDNAEIARMRATIAASEASGRVVNEITAPLASIRSWDAQADKEIAREGKP